MSLLLFVVFATLAISAVCSLMEATLYSTRVATLETAKAHKRHSLKAISLLKMKKDVARPTSAILILNTISNTAGATFAGMLAAQEFGAMAVPVFSAVLTIGILLLSEILPKTLGAVHWRLIWPFVVTPLQLIQSGLTPVIWLTQWFSGIFIKGQSSVVTTEAEILSLIRMGAGDGELTQTELELLTNVFQFDNTISRQVMVPRHEIEVFDVKWELEKCRDVVRNSQHTRYPVVEGSVDNIVGLVHVKDLFNHNFEGEKFDLRALKRDLISIPERTPIGTLLKQMRTQRKHMAAVYDEHSNFVGIVTLENVIERIIGSVQDEFDDEQPNIEDKGGGLFSVKGSTPVFEVNNTLGLSLNCPSDVDTLSGLVTHRLGRLPKAGDEVKVDSAQIHILKMANKRIDLMSINISQPD